MDWHQGDSSDKHVQFVPAEKGWLALFEDVSDEGVRIYADPVIAWCFGPQDVDRGHHFVSVGQAVIGASTSMEDGDNEHPSHFFALIREEQLDPDFVDEIKRASRFSREDVIRRAKKNHEDRLQGHASWRRQHRNEKYQKPPSAPTRIF